MSSATRSLLARTLVIAAVAVFAIVVDAKDEHGAAFYRGFGFQPFPLRPLRLFLPTATALAALQHGA